MRLKTIFHRPGTPFEGDLAFALRALPANAAVRSAYATVRAVDGQARIRETVSLEGVATGEFGVTKEVDAGNAAVLVDLGAPRAVEELNVVPSTAAAPVQVQVDLGGMWIGIDANGSFAAPGSLPDHTLTNGVLRIPQLQTQRIRVLAASDVTSVTFSSRATNVSLRIGNQGPFWFQVGELVQDTGTSDFREPLQVYLLEADVESGHAVVPITLHSDALTRLEVEFELDLVFQTSLLPKGVPEVLSKYGFGLQSESEDGGLSAALPSNAVVVPDGPLARVRGAFDPSRIALGPDLPVDPDGVVTLSGVQSQAQPFSVPEDLRASAVDLLVEPRTATIVLGVTVLEDAGGKPFGEPLLSRSVRLEAEQEVKAGVRWISAALPEDFTLRKEGPDNAARRYWLVVNATEGEAGWAVKARSSGAEETAMRLHRSEDQGLSWQATELPMKAGPLEALFRLRQVTAQFEVPIKLQVGSSDATGAGEGEGARTISFEQLQPLGRVAFDIAGDDVFETLSGHLRELASRGCIQRELLANGEFRECVALDPDDEWPRPAEWELTSGNVVCFDTSGGLVVLSSTETTPAALSQATPVTPGCWYRFQFYGFAVREGPRAEVIWKNGECGEVGRDEVPFAVSDPVSELGGFTNRPQLLSLNWDTLPKLELHERRLQAPEGVTQAEIRFLVPEANAVVSSLVSLRGSAQLLDNVEFQETGDGIPGWTLTPSDQSFFENCASEGPNLHIQNSLQVPMLLTQDVEVSADQPHRLTIQAHSPAEPAPNIAVHWLSEDGIEVGSPLRQVINTNDFDRYTLEILPPSSTVRATIEITIPPAGELFLDRVTLQAEQPLAVPLSFLAQAPGQLLISDAQITYDLAEPPPPAVPDEGLCPVTPPPGVDLGEDGCYCDCCEQPNPMVDVTPAVTGSGRPATLGICSRCGAMQFRLGGPPRSDVAPIPVTPVNQPPVPVMAVRGIGPEFARRLEGHGVMTLNQLLRLDVSELARMLEISRARADGILEAARTHEAS